MKKAINQELYKFMYQKITYYGLLIFLMMMIYSTISGISNKSYIVIGYGMGQWSMLILVAISSNFFSQEYENGTILQLFIKNKQKYNIYISKLIVVTFYDFLLHINGIVFTFTVTELFSKYRYSWFSYYQGKSLITSLFLNVFGSFFMTMLFISIIFMLVNLIKNNVITIAVGLALGFFGNPIMDTIMYSFKHLRNILRWNPFNTMSIMQQLPSDKYNKLTGLSNSQLVYAVLIYIVIFLFVGYFFFKKRRV